MPPERTEACRDLDVEPACGEPVKPAYPALAERVIVIRDLAVRPCRELVEPADPLPPPAAPEPPAPSLQQERDLAGLLGAVTCPVRQRILFALAAGPSMNVTALAARTCIAQKALSHHLGHLRAAGLVHSQRRGREIWYETAHPRIRCHRDEAGACTLTLTAPGGGVVVTVTLSCSEGKDAGP